MVNEQAAALKAMDLCRTLSGAELDAIAAIVERRDVAAGKDLFREGDPGDGLFLVISGEINVTKRAPGDDERRGPRTHRQGRRSRRRRPLSGPNPENDRPASHDAALVVLAIR